MALNLAAFISELTEVWTNPSPDDSQFQRMADVFENYWSGAQVEDAVTEELLNVEFTSGITLPILEELKDLPGTPARAADIFYATFVELAGNSTWEQPSYGTVYPTVNSSDLSSNIEPVIEEPKLFVPASEFCSEINTWCLGTLVTVFDELGLPVVVSVV